MSRTHIMLALIAIIIATMAYLIWRRRPFEDDAGDVTPDDEPSGETPFPLRRAWQGVLSITGHYDSRCASVLDLMFVSALCLGLVAIVIFYRYDPEEGTALLSAIEPSTMRVFGLLALGTAALATLRPAIMRIPLRSKHSKLASWLFDLAFVTLAAILGTIALEVSWNTAIDTLRPISAFAEGAIVFLACLTVYLLCDRHGWLVATIPPLLLLCGVAEGFVNSFRYIPITMPDITAFGTATDVAGQYSYVLWDSMFVAAGAALVGCGFGRMPLGRAVNDRVALRLASADGASPKAGEDGDGAGRARRRGVPTIAGYLVPLAVSLAALVGVVGIDWHEAIGMDTIAGWKWVQDAQFFEWGTLLMFLQSGSDAKISEPYLYDEQEAQSTIDRLSGAYADDHPGTQAGDSIPAAGGTDRATPNGKPTEGRPNIVVVMNETYSDLTVWESLGLGDDARPLMTRDIKGKVDSGPLMVPVLGGMTANSEFEFLTGLSMISVNSFTKGGRESIAAGQRTPYSLYDLSSIPAIPRQLKSLGYSAVATHPCPGNNWDRDTRYGELGFDEFIDRDGYDDEKVTYFHSGLTDRDTYDVVMGLLEERDEPMFVFDVTMQNHGGYDQGNIPEDMLTHHGIKGMPEERQAELDEYMSCMAESDRALAELLERLSSFDEPTVLLVFGDHQPTFSPTLSRLATLIAEGKSVEAESEATEPTQSSPTTADEERLGFQTCYMMWSNYGLGLAGKEGGDGKSPEYGASGSIGLNTLGARLIERIGLPLTSHQKASIEMSSYLPASCLHGLFLEDGRWVTPDTDEFADAVHDMLLIDYLAYGKGLANP